MCTIASDFFLNYFYKIIVFDELFLVNIGNNNLIFILQVLCFFALVALTAAQYGHGHAYSSQHISRHDGHPEVVHVHGGHGHDHGHGHVDYFVSHMPYYMSYFIVVLINMLYCEIVKIYFLYIFRPILSMSLTIK